jgi:hypothetical protein
MSNEAPLQIKTRLALTLVKAMGAAAALIAMSALPAAAAGSAPCAPRPDILKQLSKQYNEAPVALGLANNGALIELLTSDDGKTWTILVSRPNGPSCLVAAGQGWEDWEKLKPAARGERGA